MRIAIANHHPAIFEHGARGEAEHHPAGNAEKARHHSHRRRELLAVPGAIVLALGIEQPVCEVGGAVAGEDRGRVPEASRSQEESLEGEGAFEVGLQVACGGQRQRPDSGIEVVREIEVSI